MNRLLVITTAALGLLAACSKESESEESGEQPTKKERRSVGGDSPGGRIDGPGGKSQRNPYAEKNWPLDEETVNEWTEKFRNASTPAEKIAVVERKQSSGPESLPPLIRLALREPDESVRTEAAMMLSSFSSIPGGGGGGGSSPVVVGPDFGSDAEPTQGEVVDLVVGATHDSSSEVRILAMEAALELPQDTQIEIYKRTIAGSDEEIRKRTIVELGRMLTKPAFEVLITGLQNTDESFRQQVNFEAKLLVNRKFKSFEEAQTWWAESAANFADNMVEIGGSE